MLEVDLGRKLNLPLKALEQRFCSRRGDLTERCSANSCGRIVELGRIEEIEELCAQL